jgi:hypothetical protein
LLHTVAGTAALYHKRLGVRHSLLFLAEPNIAAGMISYGRKYSYAISVAVVFICSVNCDNCPINQGNLMNIAKNYHLLCYAVLCIFLYGCSNENLPEPDTTAEQHDHRAHIHAYRELLSINPSAQKPLITLSAEADSMSGWNIHIGVNNFTFAPEKVNKPVTAATEGHAHIYVDGYKMARIYSHWYHLKELTAGEHTIRVSLNANDHSSLSYNSIPLDATINIIQQ